MAGAAVEVKCLDTFAYYPAYLKDYDNSTQVLVTYPNAWKSDEWVLLENVRLPPPPFDPSDFHPAAGETVEAQAKSSDDEPYSWWKASIKTVRGEFYMISYSSWEDEFNEILEKDMLRPFNKNPPLRAAELKKLELPLPKDLREGTLDVRQLNSVLETSGAMCVTVDNTKQSLIILGNGVSVKRAQLLAGMAFKHLGEIQRLKERTAKHQETLNQLKQRLNEGHLEVFSITPPELIGLVIGQAGKNIRRVEKMPGVLNVRVDSSRSQVSILAKSEGEAKAAREQLEYIEHRFPILRKMAGRVVGKSFSNMEQIQKDSGVIRIRLDNKQPASNADPETDLIDLLITGTRETVDDAVLLLNHHMEFLRTVMDLSSEDGKVAEEIRKMNNDSGRNEPELIRITAGGAVSRGGYAGRGARGPRQQGNRQYTPNDFPPLPSNANKRPQPQQQQQQQQPPQQQQQQPAAPVQQQQQQQQQSQQSAPQDRQDYQRGGRGRGNQQRGGRGGQQRSQQPRSDAAPASAPAADVAASAAPAPAATESSSSAPSNFRPQQQQQQRNPNRQRNQPRQKPQNEAAPAAAAAASDAQPAADASASAPAASAQPATNNQNNQNRPRKQNQNQNQRKPQQQQSSNADAAAASSDASAAPAAAAAAAANNANNPRPQRRQQQGGGGNQRGPRRERQPASDPNANNANNNDKKEQSAPAAAAAAAPAAQQ